MVWSIMASRGQKARLFLGSSGPKPKVRDRDSCPPYWQNSSEKIPAAYGGPCATLLRNLISFYHQA